MSWLRFSRSEGRIYLYSGDAPAYCAITYQNLVGSWPAHNRVQSSTKAHPNGGLWPPGIYKSLRHNPHSEMGAGPACHVTKYGCEGTQIFEVKGRSGMAVHAGRAADEETVGGMTDGCIRVAWGTMLAINELDESDRIQSIMVDY